MRSVPAGSFERLACLPALWRAFLRCQRGKRRQPAMAAFDLYADEHVCALHRALREGRYSPGPYALRVIHDPKTRLIAAAPIRDRVVHQALVTELAPHYEPGFLDQSYACSTGRGPQRAVLRYLAEVRRFRFRLPLDIRRYFPSVRHEILRGLFFRRLRDPRTRFLLGQFIDSGAEVYRAPLAVEVLGLIDDPLLPGSGLPIGSYLSQWSGAFYLDGLDHFVKRDLKVPGYLRYMDDLVLFGDDAGVLEAARGRIATWLWDERGLSLNPKRGAVHDAREPGIFLGYRISQAGLLPGPKVRRRMRERLRLAARRGHGALERSIRAYRGVFLY